MAEDGTPTPIRNRCQFSWYCDGKSDEVKDEKTYQKILDFARLIMHNDIQFVDITDGATHYHADYVKPDWTKTKTRTTEIGDHIFFYRWDKEMSELEDRIDELEYEKEATFDNLVSSAVRRLGSDGSTRNICKTLCDWCGTVVG